MTAFGLLARYELMPRVSYNKLLIDETKSKIEGKRILDLDNEFSIFVKNELSPPFLNYELTQEIVAEPDYYENVILVDRLFREDPPSIILDRNHRMEAFFKRIPYLEAKYSHTSFGYTRK
jgi:hypothetical protein